MSLAATLGEVKPRATPDHVVAGLKAGFYKEWISEGCDTRCPICLDDVCYFQIHVSLLHSDRSFDIVQSIRSGS